MVIGGATANAVATVETLTAAGVETINMVAATGTAAATVSALVATSATAINITGSASPVSLTTGANAIASNLSVTATGSGVHTINFAGATGNGVSITTGTGNDIITGTVLSDVIRGGDGVDTITGLVGADVMTGGAGNDTFVFTTLASTQAAAGWAAGNTTAANIDSITDFVGNGAAAGDTIKITAVSVIATGVTTAADSTAVVTAITVATAADFTSLAAAAQAVTAGTASVTGAAGAVQMYDVTVTAGTMAGRYLIINDTTNTIQAGDTYISLTGVTGALNAQDFSFAA
jgi:Ca2+-binding RTX toxin-like protein